MLKCLEIKCIIKGICAATQWVLEHILPVFKRKIHRHLPLVSEDDKMLRTCSVDQHFPQLVLVTGMCEIKHAVPSQVKLQESETECEDISHQHFMQC